MLFAWSILSPRRQINMAIFWDALILIVTALFCLVAGSYFPTEYEVYMLVESMGGASVRDVWLGINNSSGVQRHYQNLTLRQLIPKGDFRTDLNVDQLPHKEVLLVFLNAVADPLWWIAFNGTAVEERKWFQEVTRSSSNIQNHNIYVNISNSNDYLFSLYVGTGGSTQPAWAAILNPTKDSTPQFIFNADQNNPHELPKDIFPSEEKSRRIGNISCTMIRPNVSVVENELMISQRDILSEFTSTLGQLYLRGHQLSYSLIWPTDSYSYSMYYSLQGCNVTTKKPYINISSGTIQEYTLGDFRNTTLIPIACIWFGPAKPLDDIVLKYLDHVSVELEICTPRTGQFFFPADYLAIIGTKHLRASGGVTDPPDRDHTTSPVSTSPSPDDAVQETKSSTQVLSAMKYFTRDLTWGTIQGVFSRSTVENKETYTVLSTTDKLETVATESSTQESVSTNNLVPNYGSESNIFQQGIFSRSTVDSKETYTVLSTTDKFETVTTESSTQESVSTNDIVPNYGSDSDIFQQGIFSRSTVDNKEIYTSLSTTDRLETMSTNSGQIISLSSILPTSTSKSPSSTEITTPDYVTTIWSAVSKTDLSTNSNMTSSSVLCTCECYQTNDSLEKKLEQIKNILKVDKKTLSSRYRKYNSAHDPRPSSRSIGATGVLVLVAFFGIIVLVDLTNFLQR